ncbi:hypothetical protein OM076_15710 [Solirubrobacter ginsenosidimutans]|uniref:Uncharacterized protein n=1 Tax=Solirubrobacter ginsenosidimutans TaxID=490573 RepID=A0A9X3MUW6_9ACTN|nr:hypothetical protein [Solirubrobacter ginsenosidimutans]MDA0161720.1 hypothetical protein [Solirubrobacter ginsenosidimutans]
MTKSLLVAVLALLLVLPAAARAETETVTSGNTTATLTWTPGQFGVTGAALTITRDGVTAFNQSIPDVVCDECSLPGNGADDVKVVNLDGLDDLEVLVTSYTGGQHCCTLSGIYDFNAAKGTYDQIVEGFASAGYNLDDLDHDGRPEFVTQDVRFEDLFTSHVSSFPPPQVFDFVRQDDVPFLADVTTKYTTLIRSNAAEAKRSFAKAGRNDRSSRGVIAAYVADQYLLGHGSTGLKELDRQIKRGVLGSKASAKTYRSKLLRLLRDYGYR